MKPRIAQRCCGKTKTQVKANPVIHSVCNCNNCKQRTGSAFGISAYFYDEDVKIIEDATSVYALKNDLGEQKRPSTRIKSGEIPCCQPNRYNQKSSHIFHD